MSTPNTTEMNSNRELELRKEWLTEAHKQTLETLPVFIDHIIHDYFLDYGTSVHAVAAIASAAAWAANHEIGLTGFQAGCVMWDFIDGGWEPESRVGKRLIDWDHMLYPQYRDYFTEHTIPAHIFKNLQKEARKNLRCFLTNKYTEEQIDAMADEEIVDNVTNYLIEHSGSDKGICRSDTVVAHWISIVKGEVPFGYRVED